MHSLDERRALLTGASGGLGRYIAHSLAVAGADLVLSGRNGAALAEVAADVRALGRTPRRFPPT